MVIGTVIIMIGVGTIAVFGIILYTVFLYIKRVTNRIRFINSTADTANTADTADTAAITIFGIRFGYGYRWSRCGVLVGYKLKRIERWVILVNNTMAGGYITRRRRRSVVLVGCVGETSYRESSLLMLWIARPCVVAGYTCTIVVVFVI
jgi:hypothetical protein